MSEQNEIVAKPNETSEQLKNRISQERETNSLFEKKWIVTPGLKPVVDEFVDLIKIMYDPDSGQSKRKPLMICGDTGVGKSLFVKIFATLYCKKAEIRTLNCASFDSNLILSELFGHEKGAFTNADKMKPGLLEAKNVRLVILEEIGELIQPDQAKLLTFLENGGRFYRLGGTEELQSNVLIISTTHQPASEFRLDFWNRFFQFYVPAVHERRADVLYYFAHFYPELIKTLNAGDILTFLAYHWPGNVREIENVGCLMQWKDRFRDNLGGNIGKTVTGILYRENKFSKLNCDVRTRLMRLHKYGIPYNKLETFFKRIGFEIQWAEPLFREGVKLSVIHNNKFNTDNIYTCSQIEIYYASLYELCRLFLHVKSVAFDIWSADLSIDHDLLDIKENDSQHLSNEVLVWGNFTRTDENNLQRCIFKLRTGREFVENDKNRTISQGACEEQIAQMTEADIEKLRLDVYKKRLIEANGVMSEAARLLKINEQTFRRYVRKHPELKTCIREIQNHL